MPEIDIDDMHRKYMHGMVCVFIDTFIDYFVNLEHPSEDFYFLDMAENYNIVKFREPTTEEFSNPNWFGHAFKYEPDALCVCEKTPEFIAMVAAEKAARTAEIERGER